MKTITILCLFFVGLTTNIFQKEVTSKAVYDGYFEGVYSFTIEGGENFVEETIEFYEISDSILEQYDLQSSNYDGQHFSITYNVTTEKVENEDGEEEELISYKLVSIRKN